MPLVGFLGDLQQSGLGVQGLVFRVQGTGFIAQGGLEFLKAD